MTNSTSMAGAFASAFALAHGEVDIAIFTAPGELADFQYRFRSAAVAGADLVFNLQPGHESDAIFAPIVVDAVLGRYLAGEA